jgi:signal transduction histidine kinase
MQRLTQRTLLFLAVDVALIVFCVFHIPSLVNRAQPPFTVHESSGRVLITEITDVSACPNVRSGDELVLWEGKRVSSQHAVEFFAVTSPVDAHIPLTLLRGSGSIETTIRLVRGYSLSYIIIVCVVGLLTWCLGVFVLVSRPGNPVAGILHWSLISMAVTVVTAYEGITPSNQIPLLSSLLFFFAYAGTATAFFLFTLVFPRPKPGSLQLKMILVFPPALFVLAFMIYHHTRALLFTSVEEFIAYYSWFDLFHMLLLVYVGGGLVNFVHSYITAATTEERKKLKWILWGLCLGPTPFLTLVIVPKQVGIAPPIPEEYTLLALVVIPIAFVVSFMKHRLLDIELVIRRTTAYAIIIGGLLAGYVVLVSAVASFVGQFTASAGAAILVALLFEPLRTRVQHFVDKRFFRVQYNFRHAEHQFLESIKRALSIAQLGETLVQETQGLIPVERIGFFTIQQPGNRLQLVAHEGFSLLLHHVPKFEAEKLKTGLQHPVALTDRIEPGVRHESADADVFHRWGMAIVFALLSQHSEFLGFLVLGNKKSGARFSSEDVDLLGNICTQAGLTIERILLQQRLFIEQAEGERLKELNQLKSDFVSYVSHELRSPLTSIKMFAELLRGRPRRLDAKGREYARIIEGESDRLNHMVSTILDAAKMDKDMNIYEFKEVDLVKAAEDALAIMHYQLDKQGFQVKFSRTFSSSGKSRKSATPLLITADLEATVQAITNLIANAIKYSGKKKYLKVSLLRDGRCALCRIQDKGVGISPEAIPHLFDKFYRDPTHSKHVQGVGLGLPLVQHIVQAHKGTVHVESVVGKGSTFTLSFPLKNPSSIKHSPEST